MDISENVAESDPVNINVFLYDLGSVVGLSIPFLVDVVGIPDQVTPSVEDPHLEGFNVHTLTEEVVVMAVEVWCESVRDVECELRIHFDTFSMCCDTLILVLNRQGDAIRSCIGIRVRRCRC